MTDILITDGDIAVTENGNYVFLKGIDALLYRTVLCAKIKKGSFIYNKDLGTELYLADNEKTATMLIRETLTDTEDFDAEVEKIEKADGGKLIVWLLLRGVNEIRREQVTLNADL